MYQGKYRKPKSRGKRALILLASVMILASVTIFGTLAYLTDDTIGLINDMVPGSVPNTVVEKTENGVKEDVQIKNVGNVDAYIRATVVVTWADGQGNVLGEAPVEGDEEDYSLTLGENTGWEQGDDGYYYYTAGPVAPGGTTDILIENLEQNADAPVDGYFLSVEIMGQSVQALGVDEDGNRPVTLVWPVTVNADGSLTLN